MSKVSEVEEMPLAEKVELLQKQLDAEKEVSAALKGELDVVCSAYDKLRGDLYELSTKPAPASVMIAQLRQSRNAINHTPGPNGPNQSFQLAKRPISIPEDRRKAIESKILATKVASIFKDKTMVEIKDRISTIEKGSGDATSLNAGQEEETTMTGLMQRINKIQMDSMICISFRKDWEQPEAYAKSFNHVLRDGSVLADMRQVNPCNLSDLSNAYLQVGRTGFSVWCFDDGVRVGRACVYDASNQAGTIIIEHTESKMSFVAVLSPLPESLYNSIPPFNARNGQRPLNSWGALVDCVNDLDENDPSINFTWMKMEPWENIEHLLGTQPGTNAIGFDSGTFAFFVASTRRDNNMIDLLMSASRLESEMLGASAWITGPQNRPVYAKFFNVKYKSDEEAHVFCSVASNGRVPIAGLFNIQVNVDNTYAFNFDPDTAKVKKSERVLADYDPSTQTGIITLKVADHHYIDAHVAPISKESYESIPDYYGSQAMSLRTFVENLTGSGYKTGEVTAHFTSMHFEEYV